METEKTPFTKQCVAVTQEFNQGHRRVVTTGPSISYQTNYNHPIQPQKNYHQAQAYNNFCVVQNQRFGNEEPIDLTIFNNRDVKERTNVPLDVSQAKVLGRFGFPQTSLMVNPQLDGIKELPLLTEVAETNKSKSRELQSAISSIMPENPMPAGGLTFEEFEEMNELTKKRRGRPPGSSNKKHKYDLGQDFKDDPELSQELEQFATMFNRFMIFDSHKVETKTRRLQGEN